MNSRKTMTEKVEEYLAYRRRLGYQLRREGHFLQEFGAFAEAIKHRGPLTVALAVQWARLPADADPTYWAIRLKVIRGFASYLAISEPGTEIPPHRLLGSVRRRQPYIYSEAEISALMAAARQLPPVNGLRPWTYVTLIGLLASTGLRISEALRFTQSDFDQHQGALLIRETKFHKSRLVPLHPSTTEALRAYARYRDCLVPSAPAEQFLITDRGTPLRSGTVHRDFHKLCNGLPTFGKDARPRRRIHDLRHTFACRRLQRWYDSERDVAHAVAALAVYLAHTKVSDPYWYVTATPELLACAAARFEPFACFGRTEDQP